MDLFTLLETISMELQLLPGPQNPISTLMGFARAMAVLKQITRSVIVELTVVLSKLQLNSKIQLCSTNQAPMSFLRPSLYQDTLEVAETKTIGTGSLVPLAHLLTISMNPMMMNMSLIGMMMVTDKTLEEISMMKMHLSLCQI